MKIEFFPLDLDYDSKENAIKLFGRTKDGKKIIVLDNSVKPYFWVMPKKNAEKIKKQIENLKYKDEDRICKVLKAEVKDIKYFDEPIKAIKVVIEKPNDKRLILDLINGIKGIDSRKEVDISLKRRYWIEKGIIPLTLCEAEGEEKKGVIKAKKITAKKESYDEPKILAFDIETYAPTGRYSIDSRDPIMTIALYGKGLKKVITWKKFYTEDESIVFKENEGDMIKEFMKIVNDYNPDYLVGYFSDSFDMPYIRTRAEKNKIIFRIAGDKVTIRRGVVKTKGIIHFDIFNFIKHVMGYSLKTENYDLDSVAKELIGEGKIDINLVKAFLAWDTKSPELEKLCEYNLNDAEITYKLAKKIMPNINELTKVVGQPAVDIVRMSYGQMVEWYLIRKAHQYKEICPNRPGADKIAVRRMSTYKGGFVYEPKPGLYENLAIMDFKGLYPSIIVTHNISAITQTKKGVKTPPIETQAGKNVYYYFKRKEGFITKAIKELIEKRNEVKKELAKDKKDSALIARSYALKTVANASYGYMGFFAARWYSKEAAEAVTAYGRKYIKDTIEKAKKEFEVVYGDTDSIIFLLGNKKRDDIKEFLKKINDKLPGYMELELEGFFPRGIFVMKKGEATGAKKKYALLNEEGEIIVKGFETIRRDWSKLAKNVQRKVLKIILKENSPKKALEYVQDVINEIRKKKFDIEDMIIRTTLQRPLETYQQIGPHVAVAKRMMQQGMFVTTGSTIHYVVTEGKGQQIRDRARTPQEAENYDAEYYVNNQIIPAVGRIFEVLGYKKEDLIKEKEQTTLGDF